MIIVALSPVLGKCTSVLLLCLLFNHRMTHSHWKCSTEVLACCWVQQGCIFKGEKAQNWLLLPIWKGYKKTNATGIGGTGMRNDSITLPVSLCSSERWKAHSACGAINAGIVMWLSLPFWGPSAALPAQSCLFNSPCYFWCLVTISSCDQLGLKMSWGTWPGSAPGEQNGSAGSTWKMWKAVHEELQAITLLHAWKKVQRSSASQSSPQNKYGKDLMGMMHCQTPP